MILNTPIPADKALKIIRSMYESNKMISIYCSITTDKGVTYKGLCRDIPDREDFFLVDEEGYMIRSVHKDYTEDIIDVIITGITQIIPTYSIGDKVLILSTGEIGEVMFESDNKDKYLIGKHGHQLQSFHWSEICRLPNDLFPSN